MIRFASKRPGMAITIVLALSCVVWGPASVGAWLGVHGRLAVVCLFHFVGALVLSVVHH